MITRWTLENFKPIRARLDLPTAPLTVLAGLNSSGKSSFLQSILLISQTLANQKLDEPLVLNGSLVRFGTFQDVCNDRAPEQKIRIGFTLDDGASTSVPASGKNGHPIRQVQAERLPPVSLDMQFEEVSPKDDEAMSVNAVRAALTNVELNLVSVPSVSVDVRPASSAEEAEFALSSDGQLVGDMLPHPSGHNYVARIRSAMQPPVDDSALVELAHVVPRKYVERPERVILDSLQLAALIRLLGSNPSVELKESVGVRVSLLLRTHGAINEVERISEESRKVLNSLASRSPTPSFEGSSVDDLIGWFVQNYDTIGGGRLRALVLTTAMFDVLRSSGQAARSVMEAELVPTRTLERAAQQIIDTLSNAIRYLGPLRADPYATQSYSPLVNPMTWALAESMPLRSTPPTTSSQSAGGTPSLSKSKLPRSKWRRTPG